MYSCLKQTPGIPTHQIVETMVFRSYGYHHDDCYITFSRVCVLLPEPRFLPHSAASSSALCLSTSSSNSLPSNPPPRVSCPAPSPSPSVVGRCQSSAFGALTLGVSGGDWLFPNITASSRPLPLPSPGLRQSLGTVLGGRRREVNAEEDLDLVAMVVLHRVNTCGLDICPGGALSNSTRGVVALE